MEVSWIGPNMEMKGSRFRESHGSTAVSLLVGVVFEEGLKITSFEERLVLQLKPWENVGVVWQE